MDAVDLQQYFPAYAQVEYRKADGSNYARYTFQAAPTPVDSLYNSYMSLGKSGSTYTWIKDYWRVDAWCRATYAVLFMGDDGSVTETGDWMTSSTPCSPNTMLGYKQSGVNTGLVWSPAGGLADAKTVTEMDVWRQNSPGAAYNDSTSDAYSKVGLIEVLPYYAPPYGRDSEGVWREGGSKTYTDVIHIVMYHGTRKATPVPIRCVGPVSARGAYYQSQGNYNTYAMVLHLAIGVGIIQETTLYIEDGAFWNMTNCNGDLFQYPGAWTSYIDQQ